MWRRFSPPGLSSVFTHLTARQSWKTLGHAAMTTRNSDITQLLHLARAGDNAANDRLIEAVHDELKRIARTQMRSEWRDQTLQATALVNEAYLELFTDDKRNWQNRQHFFSYAATVMRHLLVSYARRRAAAKRGGGQLQVTLTGLAQSQTSDDLIALDEALSRLAELDERKSRIVELRFFGGLSIAELSDELNLGQSTIHKELKAARGWLFNALTQS